jgi:hypothetical protein
MMRWGSPPTPKLGSAPVTNGRTLKSPYWRGWLKAEWRTDRRPKVTHWIALNESRRCSPSRGSGGYGPASGMAKLVNISSRVPNHGIQ